MNIAAYCRVSTDTADQLNSLDAQKRFFEEYTSKTGDNLVRIYADEGISGVKIKNRTEFQRLMRDAQHGLFDMVVVKDISRFARNTVDLLNSEGIKTKRDYKWSQNAISRILTNELYTGKIVNGKQEVEDFLTGVRKEKDESEWYIIDKPELRIIEDETFVKAAKLLEQRNNSFNINHERQSNKHLYSTLIKCTCCGYSFRRTERCYKNTYIKWVCSGRNANGKDSCNNMAKIDEAELTEALQEYFTEILSTKQNAIKNIVDEFNRIYHSKDDQLEQVLHNTFKDLESILSMEL